MIRGIVHRMLLRRHFWRYASFSEVAELYASRTLRMVGVNIAGMFVSIYLYQNGYSVQFILFYWAAFYVYKTVMALPLAQYVARYGPKHAMLLSNFLYIPAMAAFTQLSYLGMTALVISGVFQATSATLYNQAYLIDFSRIKSLGRAGKELAFMNIFERIARGASPLIGGVVAFVAGPVTVLWLAAVLFSLAALPLFWTGEPIETHRRLVFRGFPWRLARRSLIGYGGFGFDYVAVGNIWVLLVAIAVVGVGSDNKVYAVIGGLATIAILADVVTSYVFGQLIDRRRGGMLLRVGVVVDALVHLVRPFVHTVGVAGGVNVANEVGVTAYTMAYNRGVFDVADRTGQRVTYIGFAEVAQDAGAVVAMLVAAGCVSLLGVVHGLRGFFFVAAIAILALLIARFPLYRR